MNDSARTYRRNAGATLTVAAVLTLAAVVAPLAAREPSMASLEARLQRTEDLLAIQQLLGDYATYMDASDYVAYSQLFTSDGELLFQTYHLKGPQAIREQMEQGGRSAAARAPAVKPAGLRHLISNIVIRIDGEQATSAARWITMSQGSDGRPVLGATGHYADTLRREGGKWKFQRRVIYADFPFQDPLATP